MPTFTFAKLVRDNIWLWFEQAGHTVTGKRLSKKELVKALCIKLHEEADEVDGALSHEELVEELADVQQIIDDLCATEDISVEQLQQAKRDKTNRKGGFKGGYYIETVTMPNNDDKWAIYCRKNPDKFPESESA